MVQYFQICLDLIGSETSSDNTGRKKVKVEKKKNNKQSKKAPETTTKVAETTTKTPETTSSHKPTQGLNSRLLIGYYHTWDNSGNPFIKLRDVDKNWDVINISFAEPVSAGSTDGKMKFNISGLSFVIYNSEPYTQLELEEFAVLKRAAIAKKEAMRKAAEAEILELAAAEEEPWTEKR